MTGQDEEIKFWKKFLENTFGDLTWDEVQSHAYITGNKQVYKQFAEAIKETSKVTNLPIRNMSVLDVGSGAVNVLGCMVDGDRFELTQTDTLAHEYQALLEYKYTNKRPIKDNMCRMTWMNDSFDVVHCSNALDHSEDPNKAISEMKRVARHCVFLRHFQNVGKVEQYRGMHQWDIDEFCGGLSIGAGAICVNFPEFYAYRRQNHEGIDFVYAIYRK